MPEGKPLITIGRLRLAMVAGGAALLLVLAGYIAYGRYLRPHFKLNVKLHGGDQVTIDSGGVTYSHTNLGVTEYTVHAATEIKHQDGKLTLKDVGIVLYGSRGDRSDHIHGSEFEYDPKAGVMTGVGEVYIDLAPPPPADGKKATAKADDESKIVHLKTSGLVFKEKEQLAATDNRIDFQTNGMAGSAVGASYDSGNGIIVLRSQVHVSGLRGKAGASERPMVLTALHAEIDLEDGDVPGNVAFLQMAKLVSATETGTQTATAQHAVVHMSTDGTPKRVVADGDVTLTGEGRGTVRADKLDLDISPAGQPTAAHMAGSVHFVEDAEDRREDGRSNDARVAFDSDGRPVHAVMTGAVQAKLAEGRNTRTLDGDTVELALAGGGKEPVRVREADATGATGARMRLVDAVVHKDAQGKPMNGIQTTDVKADLLHAKLAENVVKPQLTSVDGNGRTMVERTLVDSASRIQQWKETGTGDVLKLNFQPEAAGKSQLARAEQSGGVKIVRVALPKPAPAPAANPARKNQGPDIQHAEGDDAVYEADKDRMTLTGLGTGQVEVSDPESALFADRVTFDRATGDGTADGDVRVSYLQQGSTGEPVHVLAARSIGHKATGISQFFSGPGGKAKMWQGGSQVDAPELDFDRNKKTLFAHGAAVGLDGNQGQPVRTVIVDSGPPTAPAAPGKPAPRQKTQPPVRVLSRDMLYTDATRQAIFRGPVSVDDQDGELRAREVTVYLTPKDQTVAESAAPAAPTAGAPITLGGKVDRIIAVGSVEVEQPGREATGERLVYTASDRVSVLTGTKDVPPKAVDPVQGTVIGAALRFRSGDDSVEVLSGTGSERVHTETHLRQKQ